MVSGSRGNCGGPREVMDWVEARGIWKRYGSTVALRGISARFARATVTVVEGRNGAGKSTLLSILGGLARPSRGEVWYEPLGNRGEVARGHVGWVGHESLCYPGLSVRQNVELAAALAGVDAGAAWQRAAERFGLAGLEARLCGTLSRGQLQRVSLSRGLVHDPALVLLDEPYTGLDATLVERLDAVVREERERGAIVIVVSHDATAAARLGAERLLLERGVAGGSGASGS